jgi:hypothetical protein
MTLNFLMDLLSAKPVFSSEATFRPSQRFGSDLKRLESDICQTFPVRVVDFAADEIFPAAHFGSVAIFHRRDKVPRLDDAAPESIDLYDRSMRHVLALPSEGSSTD